MRKGPMDYTGSYAFHAAEYFVHHYPNNTSSVGTRAYQMALYVFEYGF